MKKLLILILILFVAPCFGEEEIDYYKFTNLFAKCAAVYNHLALSQTSTEKEYEEHMLHQIANGSTVVALDFARTGGYKDELVTSLYDTHMSMYKTLEKSSIAANNLDEYEKTLKEDLDLCVELNKFQAEYIDEKKKQIYSK